MKSRKPLRKPSGKQPGTRLLAMIALAVCIALSPIWFGRQPTAPEPDAPAVAAVPAAPAATGDTVTDGPDSATAGGSISGTAQAGAGGCMPELRYLDNGDGTTTPVEACVPEAAEPPHAYLAYPDDALARLAWGDARAAEILAMRLRERDRTLSLSLIFRAAALAGGDPAPILAYSNAYPEPTAVDGVPVPGPVRTKYVLAAVAELLGAGKNNLPYWEAVIRRASTDPDRELALLSRRAAAIVEDMRAIESGVTGRSTIVTGGGQDNG